MSEEAFLDRWRIERPFYEAWGAFVANAISEALGRDVDVGSFIKIPVVPRTKAEESLLLKAFYRNKPYINPFDEIEDKVGMRFVVLLTADINKIQEIIEESAHWHASLDKDFEDERDRRPLEFVYQSKHYVLRAVGDFTYEGVLIRGGTPCEVQIRTLLQHAHSELTHDNIYKREEGSEVTKRVERTVAKSMALIEAVDDYFVAALSELRGATAIERSALEVLDYAYAEHVGLTPLSNKSGGIVVSSYKSALGDDLHARLTALIEEKPFIIDKIKERLVGQLLYRQSWILLIYLLATERPRFCSEHWPFPVDDLRPIFVDIGRVP